MSLLNLTSIVNSVLVFVTKYYGDKERHVAVKETLTVKFNELKILFSKFASYTSDRKLI